MTVLMTTATIR